MGDRKVPDIVHEARAILRGAIAEYDPVAVCGLFSGGNDSTVLLDMCTFDAQGARDPLLTHVVHINTTVGVEQTREYVRHTAKDHFGLPYIEQEPPLSYEQLVMGEVTGYGGGFPGPGAHHIMYARLKERALAEVRNSFIDNPHRQRVMFVAGTRQDESDRRFKNISNAIQRQGSIVWVSPITFVSNGEMKRYRDARPNLPRNEVSDHLHMSGECLCGAFAKPHELAEIAYFYPETARQLVELEERVKAAHAAGELREWEDSAKTDKWIPANRCKWGWGAYREWNPEDIPESGLLCSGCQFFRGQEAKPDSDQLSFALSEAADG